jgi:segregation and condensation protein B
MFGNAGKPILWGTKAPWGRPTPSLPGMAAIHRDAGCPFHHIEAIRARQPQPAGGVISQNSSIGRLEAVLFVAEEPMGSRKLAQLADLADGTETRTLVRTLNRRYDEEGWAFRVVEVAGGFQLLTRAKFAPWLRRLHATHAEVRLSAPAMETLAVVAYRQPVLRAEIETIRGVQCGEILRQLMDRDLVRIVGRSEELGRPFLYGTTKLFLQTFGLRHLDELPRPELRRNTPVRGNDRLAALQDRPDGHSITENQETN